MSKHTPGPWALMPGNPLQVTDMLGHPDPLYLAEINGNNKAQAAADARLIAAAPDLLEALQHLLTDAIALDLRDSAFSGVLIEARAAIAKAEGK